MAFRDEITPYTTPDQDERRDWRLEGYNRSVQYLSCLFLHRFKVGDNYFQGGYPQTASRIKLPALTGEARFFKTATLWVYAQSRLVDNPSGYRWVCQTNRFTSWNETTGYFEMITGLTDPNNYVDMSHEYYAYPKATNAPYHEWVPFRIGYISAETEAGVPKGVKAIYEENGYAACEIGLQLAIIKYDGTQLPSNLVHDTSYHATNQQQFLSTWNFPGTSYDQCGIQSNSFEYVLNASRELSAFIHFSYEPEEPPPLPPVDPPRRGGAVRSIEELIADTTIHIGQLSHARRIISTAQRQRNLMYRNEDSPSSIKTNILVHQDNAGNVVSQALTDLKALNFQHQIVSKCLPEQLLRVETGKKPPAGSTMTKYLNERYYLIGMNLWEDSHEVEMGWSISYITVSHLRHYGAKDSGYLDEATGWDDFLPGDTVRIETSAVFPDGRSASGTYRIASKGAGASLGSHLNIQGLWGTPVQDATVYVPDCVITLLERSPV